MSRGFVMTEGLNLPVKAVDPYGDEHLCVAFIEYSDGVSWVDPNALNPEPYFGPPPLHHLFGEVTYPDGMTGDCVCEGFRFAPVEADDTDLNAQWSALFGRMDNQGIRKTKDDLRNTLKHERSALDAERIRAGLA